MIIENPSTLDWLKSVTSILSAIVSSGAIIVGGYLAYKRWGRERPKAKRANLAQSVQVVPLNKSQQLVHVKLSVKNTGLVSLTPVEAYTLLYQILPMDKATSDHVATDSLGMDETKTGLAWPLIARLDYPVQEDALSIDSGEEEQLHAEFIITAKTEVLSVYSLMSMDPDDPDLGWDVTDIVNVKQSAQVTKR